MADGIELVSDLSVLDKNLQNLAKKSDETSKAIIKSFQNISQKGVKPLLGDIQKLGDKIVELGGKSSKKNPLEAVSKGAAKAMDDVNKVDIMLDKIVVGGKTYSNSKLTKMNQELDAMYKKLGSIQTQLHTALSLEKVGGLGLKDKQSNELLSKEADSLMRNITLLEKERDAFVRASQDKIKAEEWYRKVRNRDDGSWQKMEQQREREQKSLAQEAKVASDTAKKKSEEYAKESESYRKSLDSRARFYDKWINETYNKEKKLAEQASNNAKKGSEDYQRAYNDRARFYDKWINETYEKEQLAAENSIKIEKKKYQALLSEINTLAATIQKFHGLNLVGPAQIKELQKLQDLYASLNSKRKDMELKLQGKLGDIQMRNAATVAKNNLNEFIKSEKEKTRIEKSEYAKRAALYKKTNLSRLMTFGGAMDYSKHATTLNRLAKANKYLEEARNRLSKTDSDYKNKLAALNNEISRNKKEIDKAIGKTERLKKSHRGLLDITGQLTRRLALVFSVSQITGYINKMMEVRGEFEMQQRSLQVLLKNKEQANQLWDKTLALAIKSPFRVKELITYTKQLAAYRVEAGKLYDTNKMLADVSAGLGVDMNRLILAFGQVKAANYLRGTELRQFSEAGVNILEELSKYYSEMEKKAISVGDVFEMVSNRMVKFADVEEVFKRITSEGGLFYNMQEEQSKTLKGIMMNLRDSYDIMLNEIGKDSNSSIKAFLKTTKYVVDNWRAFLPVIKAVGTSFLFYFSVKGIMRVVKTIDLVREKILGLDKATTMLGKASPWLILASAIGAVIGYLSVATNEANRLKAALNDTDSEYLGLLNESIDSYIRLTRSINDATKSTKDRAKAMSNLKSKFDGILPQEMLEEEYVRNLSDNYDEATKAMTAYYNEKARIQKEQKIHSIYEEDIQDEVSSLQEWLKKAINYEGPHGFYFSQEERTRLNASVNGIINDVVRKAIDGEIESSEIYREILDEVVEYTGVSLERISKIFYQYGRDDASDISELVKRLRENIESIAGLPGTSYAENIAARAAEGERKNVDIFKQTYSDLLNYFSKYAKMVDDNAPSKVLEDELSAIQEELDKHTENLPERFHKSINGMFEEMKESADKGSYKLKYTIQSIYSTYFNDFIDNLELTVPASEDILTAAKNVINRIVQAFRKEAGSGEFTDFQKQVHLIFEQAASRNGTDMSVFADLFPSDTKINRAELLKNIKSEFDGIKSIIDGFKNSLAAGSTEKEAEILFGYTSEQIKNMERQLLALNEAYQRLGGERIDEKDRAKKEKEAVKILKNRINLIKELNSKYNELNKTFDSTTSKEKVMESYADSFRRAFEGTGINFKRVFIDGKKIDELKKSGGEIAGVLSEEVEKKLREMSEKGSYVRGISESFIAALKQSEGFISEARDIGDGKYTYGYGETSGVKKGDKITKEQADAKMRERLNKDFISGLNEVLDKYDELIITQEQYDSLVDLSYQGGVGAAEKFIEYAVNYDKGVEHIINTRKKIESVFGAEAASRFNDEFVEDFKTAENVYERMALLMQTFNLTVKGGKISRDLYEGMQKRADERASLFSGYLDVAKALKYVITDISQVDFTSPEGVVSMMNQLEEIARKEGPEALIEWSRAVADFNSEIGTTEKELKDKNIIDAFENMFGDYEISIELDKMDIPKDLAKRLFNLDAMSLDELKSNLLSRRAEFVGTDMEKKYNDFLKKIEELEDKARTERLKKYTKYLVNAQTERVKIKLEELRQIEEIEETFTDERDKEEAKAGVRRDSMKKMQELEWKEFNGGDMYLRIFESLDTASEAVLSKMEERLVELRESLKELSPSELKEIMGSLEKIRDAKFEQKNLFERLFDSAKRYRKFVKEHDFDDLENKYIESVDSEKSKSKEVKWNEKQVATSEKYYKLAIKKYGIDSIQAKKAKEILDINKQNLNTKLAELVAQGKISEELAKQLADGKKAEKDLKESIADIAGKTATAFQALPQVASDLENIFGNMDAKTKDIVDSVSAIGGGIANSVHQFASGDYIGGAVSAIGAISAIFQIGDKKKERKIQREMKFVEELQKQYEKLGEAIEKAYAVDTLNLAMEKSDQNIKEQIASRERMIQMEEDKKKTDHDRIEQWKDEIEELQKRQEELRKEQVGNMGGTYDYKTGAEEFISAWIEAYKETGEGLDGLKKHFQEFAQNLLLKQAVMRGAAKIIEPLEKKITDSLEKDFTIDDSEWSEIDAEQERRLHELNEFLKRFYGKYEGIFNEGGDSLTDLQKGIQGITENTAEVIAAYLNSVRFYVSDMSLKISQIADSFFNEDNVNPMLSQMKIVARNTTAIYELFDSIVKNGHPQGGAGIRVFVD